MVIARLLTLCRLFLSYPLHPLNDLRSEPGRPSRPRDRSSLQDRPQEIRTDRQRMDFKIRHSLNACSSYTDPLPLLCVHVTPPHRHRQEVMPEQARIGQFINYYVILWSRTSTNLQLKVSNSCLFVICEFL